MEPVQNPQPQTPQQTQNPNPQTPPVQPTQAPPPQNPSLPNSEGKKMLPLKLIIGTIVFLLLAGGAAASFIYREPLMSIITKPKPAPAPIVTPTPTTTPNQTLETVAWESYINSSYKFTVKYPKDWSVAENDDGSFTLTPPGAEYYANNLPDNDPGSGIVPGIEAELKDVSYSEMLQKYNSANGCSLMYEVTTLDKTPAFYCENEGAPFHEIFIAIPVEEGAKTFRFNLYTTHQDNIDMFNRENGTEVENADREIFNQILSTFKFIDSKTIDTSNWQTYTDTYCGYTIDHPNGWDAITLAAPGGQDSDPESNIDSGYTTHFTSKDSTGKTLEVIIGINAFREDAIEYFRNLYSTEKIYENSEIEDTLVDGVNALKITRVSYGNPYFDAYFSKGKCRYSISGREELAVVAEKMLETFKFTE